MKIKKKGDFNPRYGVAKNLCPALEEYSLFRSWGPRTRTTDKNC